MSSSAAVLLLIAAAVITLPTALSQPTPASFPGCNRTFSCGPVTNLSYPFTGGDRPAYCGPPEFRLTCRSNFPELTSNRTTYRVLQANQTQRTLTLARLDLWNNTCPQTFINSTLDSTIFDSRIAGNEDLTLVYGCNASLMTVVPVNRFSCIVSGTNYTDAYYLVGPIPNDPILRIIHCSNAVQVPLLATIGEQLIGSRTTLAGALTGGFTVQYTDPYSAECSNCTTSGAQCGFNPNSSRPICICGNTQCFPSGSSNNSSQLPIVLPVVGAILAGIGIGWAFFRCKQRRKRQAAAAGAAVEAQGKTKELPTSISSKPLIANASSNLTTSIPSYPSSASTTEFGRSFYFGTQVFTYEELETATENFDSRHELGEGGFGTVYYGRLVDGREVAVKRLYENNFKRVEQFLNEVEILTKLHHKNLVQLYGCTSRRSRELVLVYEYIANGTVADHLHGKLARSGASGLLSWPVRLNIAIETSEALTYLHESDIIHRDVKTNNILLEKNFRVKVADFGLSRLFPNDVTHVSTAPQGTPGYVDPEYYQCYQITNKSDVYSFGVVLIELISSLQAVDTNRHRHDINLANMAINKIQNHSLNELVDKSLGFETDGTVRRTITLVAELAFRCLQHERDMRPSMKEVLETLRGIQNEDLNVQKAEVLDIVVDSAFPPSPDSGVTDKTTSNGSMPNSSDKMIDISAR